ncbi:MAG: PH domain-containing protein [Desulfobacterales bacterium]|nr:PH domain-containing protein [Desulfobacterales bacterium]
MADNNNDDSEIIYEGGPSTAALALDFVKGIIFIVASGFIAFYPFPQLKELSNEEIFNLFETYRIWGGIIIVLFVAFILLIKILKLKSTYYSISKDRIEIEKGFLGKEIDNMDLFRIRDLKLQRTFLDRLTGIGTVLLVTTDTSHPELTLFKIKKSKELYDNLKRLSLEADSKRRVIHHE